MKKISAIILLALSAAIAPAFANAQTEPSGAKATVESSELSDSYKEQFTADKLSYREKEEIETKKIADAATYKRAVKTIEDSSKLLNFIGISESKFEGRTLGISNYAWVSTFALLVIYGLLGVAVLKIFLFIAIKISKFNKLAILEKIFSNIKAPVEFLVYFFALYVSFMRLAISLDANVLYQNAFTVIFLGLLTWAVIKIYDSFVEKIDQIARHKDGFKNIFPIFNACIRWVIVIAAFLMILQRLGFDVKAFMVSLGIGGAALAFASKDTIANFFGSISLIMDAPFKVGDRIQVSQKLDGIVESIGIRSTRIRNLDQSLSILPNSYLANEYIVNVARWRKRKASLTVGLTYDASVEQIKKIRDDIRQLLAQDSGVVPNSALVNFTTFADSSLNIDVIYFIVYIETPKYLEVVERINFEIMKIVENNGASFAFPSQSLYIEKNA